MIMKNTNIILKFYRYEKVTLSPFAATARIPDLLS